MLNATRFYPIWNNMAGKVVLAIAFCILISSAGAQIQKGEVRSNDNIFIKQIFINGTADNTGEKLSSKIFANQLSPNSIAECLWQGNHNIQFKVINQNSLQPFAITFYNLGACSSVKITLSSVSIVGDSISISLNSPGNYTGSIKGKFNTAGDSISGTYSYTNNNCGGSTNGNWYAVPTRSQCAYNIIWEETFEDLTQPSGWTVIDNDSSGVGLTYGQGVNFSAADVYPQTGKSLWYGSWKDANNNNLIDEWLITPPLNNITDKSVLIIWAGAIGGNFADSLRIWVSDTDNNLSSFDDMIAYFKVDGPIASWHEYVFDISNYAGKQIYVAANYYITDGGAGASQSDNIWIDHFAVAEPVVVSVDEGKVLPKDFELSQNYPNPFNPSTIIRYTLPTESKVTIKVYNLVGQEIRQLVNAAETAGIHEITFNAGSLASGVYFYRITAAASDGKREFVDTKKLMLIK
jgi:hypothetical protein